MSKNDSIVLNEKQIYEVKSLASKARQLFGVYPNVPIGNDIKLLLEKNGILLCEYPFPDTNGTHTYGNITWFKVDNDTITFIGLNTSSFYDEQIFAIAHEIYHYTTQTGKAYTPDMEYEDKIIEKQADRFAAELLLPLEALRIAVMETIGSTDMREVSEARILRFVARIQCDWWLPFQAIINRLYEEGFIDISQYYRLYEIDCRNEDGIYRRLLKNVDSEISELLNKKTKTIGVSNKVVETIISNYEDGLIDDDEFVRTLGMFDKNPEDFGFCMETEIDDDLIDFFESEDD
ncbi:MAG: ImmA/IrrE family metallo-endopeptidase [Lachnospiraceae bacterium]|nr:ImmA/IrrE family metallo-endopeptidase [Lachnospiraceae bacterium]